MKSIYLQLLENEYGKTFPVLATVIRTKGSTPQVPGSSALFDGNGLIAGTIGGGAVEKSITDISIERFKTRQSGLFSFNLANDISKKEEAICGGEIDILTDADPGKHSVIFKEIQKSLSEREPGILITSVSLSNGEVTDISRVWSSGPSFSTLPEAEIEKAQPVIKELMLLADSSRFCEIQLTSEAGHQKFMFFEPVMPPLKLVIAGAGHIGKALSHIGKLLGFEVVVIDDREEYANIGNIPEASEIIVGDIGKAIAELPKGRDTFIVIVTRGHKDDAEALRSCIKSDAGYLGMIGSRKKTAAIRDEFIKNGWATSSEWEKLHTPIGLEINSRTIEEIAISIAAQIIAVKNRRKDLMKGCPS